MDACAAHVVHARHQSRVVADIAAELAQELRVVAKICSNCVVAF